MTPKTGEMHRLQARSTYLILAAAIIAICKAFGVQFPFDQTLTADLMILFAPVVLGAWAALERWYGSKRLYWFKPKGDDNVRS